MEKNIVVQNVDLNINNKSGGVFNELYFDDHWMYHCYHWDWCYDESPFFTIHFPARSTFSYEISISNTHWIHNHNIKYHIKYVIKIIEKDYEESSLTGEINDDNNN